MNPIRIFCSSTLVVVACLLVGCDPDWPGPTKTANVKGSVTLDGRPLGDAQVTFIPIAPMDGSLETMAPMSYGTTDVHGQYSLQQADGKAGAVTGQHTVIISKPLSGQANDWGDILMGEAEPTNDAVPDFYRQHGYLKRHVMPLPGSHQMDFDLSSIDPLLKETP